MHIQTHIQLTSCTQYKHINIIKPILPRLIHLSNSQFLYPYLTHKSANASSSLDKELHFSLLSVFAPSCWDHVWGRDPQRTVLFRTVCQSGKSVPCSAPSVHIITQHSNSPRTSTPKKASRNLIILVFHQVERCGLWRIGI